MMVMMMCAGVRMLDGEVLMMIEMVMMMMMCVCRHAHAGWRGVRCGGDGDDDVCVQVCACWMKRCTM